MQLSIRLRLVAVIGLVVLASSPTWRLQPASVAQGSVYYIATNGVDAPANGLEISP